MNGREITTERHIAGAFIDAPTPAGIAWLEAVELSAPGSEAFVLPSYYVRVVGLAGEPLGAFRYCDTERDVRVAWSEATGGEELPTLLSTNTTGDNWTPTGAPFPPRMIQRYV
jgi:hypothetical protein